MLARKPISEVVKKAPTELRDKLALTVSLRAFAHTELGLPDNGSYTHYVELGRPYAVWNVVAAPEFSVEPKQWCYLIIGCAGYRGYYKQQSARDYASGLQEKGYETMVGGVTAYSTLGWFSDPILSSMLKYTDVELAETLFHELAHQVLYVDDSTEFNEAFATVVGEAGARKWLAINRPEETAGYDARLIAIAQFTELVSSSKLRLAELYESGKSEQQMRASKRLEFIDLQTRYEHLKASKWNGKPWFDHWFTTPPNNARLAAFSNYRESVPKFERLLRSCGENFKKFYTILKASAQSNDKLGIPEQCD